MLHAISLERPTTSLTQLIDALRSVFHRISRSGAYRLKLHPDVSCSPLAGTSRFPRIFMYDDVKGEVDQCLTLTGHTLWLE